MMARLTTFALLLLLCTGCPSRDPLGALVGVRNRTGESLIASPGFGAKVAVTVEGGQSAFWYVTERPEPFAVTAVQSGTTLNGSFTLDTGSDSAESLVGLLTVNPGPLAASATRETLGGFLGAGSAVFVVQNDTVDKHVTVGRPGEGALVEPTEIVAVSMARGTSEVWDVAFETGGTVDSMVATSFTSTTGGTLPAVSLAAVTVAPAGDAPLVTISAAAVANGL
jgi:hypothetical protein